MSARARELFPNEPTKALQWIRDNASGIDEDRALDEHRQMLSDHRAEKADERRIVTDARADYNWHIRE